MLRLCVISARATLDINSHYFNKTDETLFGEVFLNMITIPKDEVTEILDISDINNESELFLPAQEATAIEYKRMFYQTTYIRQMFAHMHKRGYMFEVFRVGGPENGKLIYVSHDYQHPPYQFFDPPLVISPNTGLKTRVYYNNETDRDISYGVSSEDEMGILFYSRIRK